MSVELTTPAAAEPEISLEDHEAAYAPDAPASIPAAAAVVDEPSAFDEPEESAAPTAASPRHRAKSQQGTADDLPAIDELTKRVRAAEAKLGITKKPGESQRVFNLRKQAEIIERLEAAKSAPAAAAPAPLQPSRPPSAPSAFTEPEPTQAQFMNAADPYGAYQRALAGWDRRKDAFEAQATTAKSEQERVGKERQEQFKTWVKSTEDTHTARIGKFVTDNPTARAEMDAAKDMELTPIMYGAVTLSERGPEIMLEYARHPELVDDLVLQTSGRPLIQPDGSVSPLVATLQRRLISRLAVAGTGSTPALRPIVPVTRPPNPVRTAPQTPSATPPGEGSSLADHERYYGPKRSR